MESTIPARLDALPWSKWHVRVVIALGITWLLDGLEASLAANLGPTLQDSQTLGLSVSQAAWTASVYLFGEVFGALLFGYLTDRFGRKKLFLITLGVYLAGTAASGAAMSFVFFMVCRFVAGAGIGGEYSAINSAIDELIPARLRGRVDLAVNGSYWLGVVCGSALTFVLLNPRLVPLRFGFRFAFGLGALLGAVILFARRHLSESPRWLLMHGRSEEAEATMREIEHGPPANVQPVRMHTQGAIGPRQLLRILLTRYRARAVLGFSLMLAQAFFYNAIFFSMVWVLVKHHHVAANRVELYMLPFAGVNFLGPVVLGGLFDRLGRRVMIPLTYSLSGILLIATGVLLASGALNALTQTVCWCIVFFFASAAASAAYLTVSELFPVELRGMAIAVFYAFATLCGALTPVIFAGVVSSNQHLLIAYAATGALMVAAAIVARVLGVDSEGKSLEAINEF